MSSCQALPGTFYFINDQYFADFPDPYLMRDKETINGQLHGRPCFYAFKDAKTGLFWMIPFSSQIEKFHEHAEKKILKYGRCDTILFGDVLGHEKAFLIQNMCPMTSNYFVNQYVDHHTNVVVRLNGNFEKKLIKTAQRVLLLQRAGKKLGFPDVLAIERQLLAK